MSDAPTTLRWVATGGSARQAARAFLRLTLRQKRVWVLVALVEVVLGFLLALSFEAGTSTASRVVWGPVFAVLPAAVLVAAGLGIAHLLNVRRFRERLGQGVVLEGAVGEDALVLRSPWAESTLSFDGLRSVQSDGSWVFVRQIGSPVVGVWPADLFSTADLERVSQTLATRSR